MGNNPRWGSRERQETKQKAASRSPSQPGNPMWRSRRSSYCRQRQTRTSAGQARRESRPHWENRTTGSADTGQDITSSSSSSSPSGSDSGSGSGRATWPRTCSGLEARVWVMVHLQRPLVQGMMDGESISNGISILQWTEREPEPMWAGGPRWVGLGSSGHYASLQHESVGFWGEWVGVDGAAPHHKFWAITMAPPGLGPSHWPSAPAPSDAENPSEQPPGGVAGGKAGSTNTPHSIWASDLDHPAGRGQRVMGSIQCGKRAVSAARRHFTVTPVLAQAVLKQAGCWQPETASLWRVKSSIKRHTHHWSITFRSWAFWR